MTWVIWLIAAVVLIILEIVTPGLFFFACLAIGSLAAAVIAYFGISNWLEFGVFAFVAVISIFAIRPFFKKWMEKQNKMTVNSNVDALIGAEALVTEKIVPEKPGFVKVRGEIWLAESDSEIEPGTKVAIESLSGTKVFVKKA